MILLKKNCIPINPPERVNSKPIVKSLTDQFTVISFIELGYILEKILIFLEGN
jgi:hypothetical protein